jgi:colanic acid/amylovoran biosynthesis protein
VVVLPDTLQSECHQAVIAGAKCVIGARYHAIVFAINNNVPFVTLNYEGRILGMLEALGKQDRVVDITLALEPPRGRRPAAEARIGAPDAGALTFEAEVAIARILDRMQRLAPDEEARQKAKRATTECFDLFVSTVKDSSRSRK